VNKILNLLLVVFFITNCSFNSNSTFWSGEKKIQKEASFTIREINEKQPVLQNEFNTDLKINLTDKKIENELISKFYNNDGISFYDGTLKSISKYSFSKIDKFERYEPEIIINEDTIIFFDDKGTILKFDNNSKLLWKKNYYTKAEKKNKPFLFFANNLNTLIVADTIAKYYAININSGELIWSKNNKSPFNSQIKIYKDKFFIVDDSNILKCFSLSDGSLIWEFKTQDALIRSQKKVSLALKNNKIIFSSTIGDLTAVDVETGKLVWQTPTRSNRIIEETMFLKISDIIIGGNSIFFSNNENEFFSIDEKTGILNWKQNINSSLRPAYIDDLIFTVTEEGFLIVIESNTGNIIRSTYLFESIKEKKRKKIKPIGFIVGKKNIYLSTNTGRLFVIDILSGKTQSVIKIDNKKISRPKVLNQNLYIAKDNSIVKLN
tara:strand:+ start:44 stop:1348 length:1305 start_codon:yes stop_codon:yes gene_type:complete